MRIGGQRRCTLTCTERRRTLATGATALAAAFAYWIVLDASALQQKAGNWAAALAAAYAFGLAPVIWSQAVITEVYGLQALLVALIIYLYAGTFSTCNRLHRWRGLALGLAMGNHVTTLLLVPLAFASGSLSSRVDADSIPDPGRSWFAKMTLDRRALLRQLGMFAVGLSLYLLIPLHALANPPINWGNAVTLERLWWLVSGRLHQSDYLQFSPALFWERMQACAALLFQQFGLPGVALGLTGLIVYWRPSRLSMLTLWTAVVFTLFAIMYGSADSYVYLIPVFLSFAVWVGLGIAGLFRQFSRWSPGFRLAIALVLLGYFAWRCAPYFDCLDASTDLRAETFGREVFSTVPENSILLAKGDQAVFALWYFHFALGERPDLAVLAVDLLHFEWYRESLRATYPSLVVPGPFPWRETIIAANPSRPVCDVQYDESTFIACSLHISTPVGVNEP